MIGGMKNLSTQKFGELVVIKLDSVRRYQSTRNVQTKSYWLCRCSCGNTKVIRGEHLTAGKITSCGCVARRNAADRLRTHGLTDTPEYRSWICMRSRVNNPDALHEKYYSGIRVDPRWNSFDNFLADMGPKPTPKHEIDRINNDGNYEPGNCRWATRSEQMLNTRRQKR